jgi:lipopolysaccharide export system protein LptA
VNWQRTARWIVAAIGVSCAVAIAVYSRRREQPPPPSPVLAKIDPNAKLEGGAGQTQQYRVGKSPLTIDYSRMRSYDDGRGHFEDAVIKGIEESRFTVRAKVMEMSAPVEGTERPGRMNLSGGVKLTTDDGLDMVSETAVWDDATNRLTMPGAVTFKKGRVSGTGLGAIYEHERDAFTLLDHAQAHVEPDADGKGTMDLSSLRMTLIRGQHLVQLEENAKIVGDTQTLTSKNATMSFTDDEKAVKYLEMRGTARVTPVTTGGTTSSPAMNADNITMSFYEDGVTLKHATLTGQSVLTMNGETARTIRASWIDMTVAPDGQTLTDLQAKDRVNVSLPATATTPGRTITSSVLSAKGDPTKGLTSARFDGSPRFEEMAATPPRRGGAAAPPTKPARWGTSVVLVLALGGQIDAIESAEFQQNAQFHDEDTVGEADVARYDEANSQLHLSPNPKEPRRLSHVATPDMDVNAVTIDVDTDSNDLKAQGTVSTVSKHAAGTTSPPSALFSGDEPVIGKADALSFTNSSSLAIYTGTARSQARLRQGQSEVTANSIEYSDTTQALNASGNVYSVWLLDTTGTTPGSTQQKTQEVTADTMAYDETHRTAVYKGAPVHVRSTDDSKVEGQTVTFRLADDSRELRTMRAQTLVWATLSGGYDAVGDVLVYDAKNDTYTLDGRPNFETAKVKTTGSDSTGANASCNLHTGMHLLLNRSTGQVTAPGEGQAPQTVEPVPCTMSLRRAK